MNGSKISNTRLTPSLQRKTYQILMLVSARIWRGLPYPCFKILQPPPAHFRYCELEINLRKSLRLKTGRLRYYIGILYVCIYQKYSQIFSGIQIFCFIQFNLNRLLLIRFLKSSSKSQKAIMMTKDEQFIIKYNKPVKNHIFQRLAF